MFMIQNRKIKMASMTSIFKGSFYFTKLNLKQLLFHSRDICGFGLHALEMSGSLIRQFFGRKQLESKYYQGYTLLVSQAACFGISNYFCLFLFLNKLNIRKIIVLPLH